MRKLEFLVGMWAGEARITRGAGETTELVQTEEAGYKLDGLILVIEGIGRGKSSVAPVLQAFGVISYEDETKTYRMRAFNDGRFLETNVKLFEEGKGMAWRFVLGEIKNEVCYAHKRKRRMDGTPRNHYRFTASEKAYGDRRPPTEIAA